MSTYSLRIILEGWGDETLELDQYERDQILLHVGTAMDRAQAARVQAEQEKARARSRERAEQNSAFIDEEFEFGQWADALFRMANGFHSFHARSAPPSDPPRAPRTPPPPAAPTRPRTPRTVTEALAVLEQFTPLDSSTPLNPRPAELRTQIRRAKRATHPDMGGTSADFQLVTAAEDVLRLSGRL